MQLARATLQLTRPDSSLLAFLSVLLPVFVRTQNLTISLTRALPLLFISMCTFIINDLDDIEKDKINHPRRPLPTGKIKPAFAATLYYLCLALALLSIRLLIKPGPIAFWYYLLLIMSISYSYIVEFLSDFKAMYVAIAVSIPILILTAYYPEEQQLYVIAAAVGVFTFGRELCMDVNDRPGDPVSFLHKIDAHKVATTAFASQLMALALVVHQAEKLLDILVVLVMSFALLLAYSFWFHLHREEPAIVTMKFIIFLGLYFLL